jgi:hypothetical protein
MPASKKVTAEAPQIIALKTNKDRKVSTVELFSIDGKAYSVPTSVRPNEALKVMHFTRTRGETAGVSYMLESMLGEEGYLALLDYDDLEEEDLEKIIKIASEIVAGALEGPKA